MDIQAIRERRNLLVTEFNDLLAKHPGALPAEVTERCTAINAEIGAIDDRIKLQNALDDARAQAMAETELRNEFTRAPGTQDTDRADNSALRSFLTGGLSALSQEQRRAMDARVNSDIRAAMSINPQAAMSTTTTTEGGYTVAPEYYQGLVEAMKAYGGMRQVAQSIRTATGAAMYFATADATSEVGEIVGQNSAVALGETTFGQLSIDVYKYSSKKIALPFELIQDSYLDLEGYIRGLLAMRLGRIQNTHFTTGTGSGQPRGIVTGAAAGTTMGTGNTAAVSYAKLLDLIHSVDPAYRAQGAAFMTSDAGVKMVRSVVDSQSRPIFNPGYETGVPDGAPDRLLGYPVIINQDIAAPAANAKSILFGKLSNYAIRDVMDLTLFRMTDSAFTLNGQVGFVAFMRCGGNLVDISGASVKYLAQSAT